MFVKQKTYNDMHARAIAAERKYGALLAEWNVLVRRINEKGGEQFLKKATTKSSAPFTEFELKKLLQLCHPDKHDGKQIATEMTKKLLDIKSTITK